MRDYARYLQGRMPAGTLVLQQDGDEITLECTLDYFTLVMRVLRDHTNCQFKLLTDITAVDYPTDPARFHIIYSLLSLRYNARLRVKVRVDAATPVPTISHLYNSANWSEREVWDRFGVYFDGHPDLRRLLTDYGFEGHPMRKDFPTEGFTQVQYDAEAKRVTCTPRELSQAPRFSNYKSSWKQVPARKMVTPE